VYPKMKMRDLSYSEFDVITLVDSVGETIVVPFCKWPVCSLRIVVDDVFGLVIVCNLDVRFVVVTLII